MPEVSRLTPVLIGNGKPTMQLERGAQVQSSDDEESLVNFYLKEISTTPARLGDFETIRADGSCAALHKLELLLEHGAVLDKGDGFHPLEGPYEIATSDLWYRDQPDMIPFMKVLVNNGATSEPVSGKYKRSFRHLHRRVAGEGDKLHHSFLFRALTSGHYNIARIFIERGGTCFGVHDRMEDIDRHDDQMPEDIREWIDAVYFL
ncbi:uncharacterized protein PG986_011653 [Apiospora aurea]|uniref:Uncharacterized protein n=1 Tax=Apiospora aurea TaxID=335848 RepID=A0ABR1PXS3_9PEZI